MPKQLRDLTDPADTETQALGGGGTPKSAVRTWDKVRMCKSSCETTSLAIAFQDQNEYCLCTKM